MQNIRGQAWVRSLKLSSLRAWRTLGRFPLPLLAGLVGMFAAIRFNHAALSSTGVREESARLMLAAWLGVPFLLALAVFAEARRLKPWISLLLQGGGILILSLYWRDLADQAGGIQNIRFWLYMASAHLLLALAPALGRTAGEEGFWTFNHRMLSRAAQGVLLSSLILLGVTVALAAVKNLFGVPLPDQAFLDPAIAVLGGFFTIHLLLGVPRPEDIPPGAPAYPRSLRLTAQFVLLPLLGVYLLILYTYALKALVTWTWPVGGGTWLILAFCGLGLATLFLVHPLESRGDPWFTFFARHFYPALIPLLFLLFAVIGRRVWQYGLTENRYLVLALAVWLLGITLHTLIDRRRDLRILPASLGLVSLLASFGPWGAFEVSRKSQVQRLERILTEHGLMVGGKLAKAPGPIPREDKREIAAIAHFLEERRRLTDLSPWLPSLDDTTRTHPVVWLGILDNKFAFLQALELPYVPAPSRETPADGLAFLCRACENPLKRVSGFDLLLVDSRSENLLGEGRELPPVGPEGPQGLRFAFEPDSGLLRFTARNPAGRGLAEATAFDAPDSALLELDLGSYFQGLRDRYPDAFDLNLPEEEMVLEREAEKIKVRLRLRSMRGDMQGDSARLKDFAADVFVQVKTGRKRK
jgi:hypothetical protein